jgi:hypothetical protein
VCAFGLFCFVFRPKVYSQLHSGTGHSLGWLTKTRDQELFGTISKSAFLGSSKLVHKIKSESHDS